MGWYDWPGTMFPNRLLFVVLISLVAIWDGVWKAIALWRAGGNRQLAWFICLIVFNTMGILPIIYIFGFSRKKSAAAPAP